MGQEIEVRPGIVSKDSEGRSTCTPIYSRIVSLFTEQNELQYAVPGGLIGVGTTVWACIAVLWKRCWDKLLTLSQDYPPNEVLYYRRTISDSLKMW